MTKLNFNDILNNLEQRNEQFIMEQILDADNFTISVFVYDSHAVRRMHTCGKDEFFYVLRGEAHVEIEDETVHLMEGEGILAKAGTKHRHTTPSHVSLMMISKEPHMHVYYEDQPVNSESTDAAK